MSTKVIGAIAAVDTDAVSRSKTMSGRPSRSTRSSTGTTRRLSPSSDTAAPAAAPPSSCALYRAIASSSPSFCSMISPTDFFSGATYRSFCEPPKDEERRGESGGAAVGAASVIAKETLSSQASHSSCWRV